MSTQTGGDPAIPENPLVTEPPFPEGQLPGPTSGTSETDQPSGSTPPPETLAKARQSRVRIPATAVPKGDGKGDSNAGASAPPKPDPKGPTVEPFAALAESMKEISDDEPLREKTGRVLDSHFSTLIPLLKNSKLASPDSIAGEVWRRLRGNFPKRGFAHFFLLVIIGLLGWAIWNQKHPVATAGGTNIQPLVHELASFKTALEDDIRQKAQLLEELNRAKVEASKSEVAKLGDEDMKTLKRFLTEEVVPLMPKAPSAEDNTDALLTKVLTEIKVKAEDGSTYSFSLQRLPNGTFGLLDNEKK